MVDKFWCKILFGFRDGCLGDMFWCKTLFGFRNGWLGDMFWCKILFGLRMVMSGLWMELYLVEAQPYLTKCLTYLN